MSVASLPDSKPQLPRPCHGRPRESSKESIPKHRECLGDRRSLEHSAGVDADRNGTWDQSHETSPHGCRILVGYDLPPQTLPARCRRLGRKVLDAVGNPVLLPPARSVANLARKARNTVRQEILPRAVKLLSAFEALALALGLEPPGLRGVVEATLAGRAGLATYRRPLAYASSRSTLASPATTSFGWSTTSRAAGPCRPVNNLAR